MTRRIIERRRGVFGWITLAIFWAWNGAMAWSTYGVMSRATEMAKTLPSAQRTGAEAGIGLGFLAVLIVWALGSLILYMLVRSTRGRREFVEVEGR
jgi:hypothetical protein